MRPSRRRVLKALQALPLQALHLAYEAGPSATSMTCLLGPARSMRISDLASRVVVSSSGAGLIITVTDGEGVVIENRAKPYRA